MKIAVQKNHLVGEIWYRSLDPVKKRRQKSIFGEKLVQVGSSRRGRNIDQNP